MTVLDEFFAGEIRALAKIISAVENHSEGYQNLVGRLYARAGKAVRIGITGPPGSGKSTLVNCLAHEFLNQGKRVGIIAVDPTSPFTGGALLGDRVRMNEFPSDGSVYFRSMATRGAGGGLASATDNVAVVYDAFGFDITLIETVGVGQVELDIIDTCDTVVVVIVPESGDAVQTMKAGLMEIGDIFCINKADRPGSERIAADLRHTLSVRKKIEGRWDPPVEMTEAQNRKGIDKLVQKIDAHLSFLHSSGSFAAHRREQIKKKILHILTERFKEEFVADITRRSHLDQTADEILKGTTNPYAVSAKLYEGFVPGE